MFTKHIPILAMLAAAIQAETPLCLQQAGRVTPYDFAFYKTVPDGRTLAFCYNRGGPWGTAVVDNNWVTDINAMLQTLVDLGNSARCVDCLPSAEPAGCTGYSHIWNIDGNVAFGDTPPPLDGYSKDVFMGLIKDAAAANTELNEFGSGYDPILTIDQPGPFREQTWSIFGDGDTC
ncbi:hypothetical protein DL764_006073 [Monosporascus ibericus]|uniref:Ecp2 effector protein domain-containing protein n=1 Tax=Monosporascus ibericus TaxID=155417 RepID=A0A4Q4T5Z7_9PEZI|nr:hypothetical protein DL764_006073 [Monosporascus ibericus]